MENGEVAFMLINTNCELQGCARTWNAQPIVLCPIQVIRAVMESNNRFLAFLSRILPRMPELCFTEIKEMSCIWFCDLVQFHTISTEKQSTLCATFNPPFPRVACFFPLWHNRPKIFFPTSFRLNTEIWFRCTETHFHFLWWKVSITANVKCCDKNRSRWYFCCCFARASNWVSSAQNLLSFIVFTCRFSRQ